MAVTEPAAARLFFALWPDAGVRDAILAVRQGFNAEAARPLHPDDLHLTLAFLGSQPPDKLPCIESVGAAVRATAPVICLDRLGGWAGPRVSWLGAPSSPALTALVDQLWQGVARCGLSREPRAFCPHVTLHRKIRAIPERRLSAPIVWHPSSFVLAESVPAAGAGPRYRVRRRWPFAASGG